LPLLRRLVLRRLVPFQGGHPEFELVDPVAEDLQLGIVSEPPLGGAAQPR
jgi:hypothetical protein